MQHRWFYALVFAALGAYLLAMAATIGGYGWLAVWPTVSMFIVAAAYAGVGPRVFGKRPNGTLAWWSFVINLPFLLFAWSVWHLQRLLTREPSCHEVAPGLWLGRRPLPHELPTGITTVVDLTAEFFEPRRVRDGRTFECLPTLDACLPSEADAVRLVRRIAADTGIVYVHCAQGHGRSGIVVAAVLLVRGLADDPAKAVAAVRAVRPGVHLRKAQRVALARIADAARACPSR
jgi:protein-tyrosine phosphatase